MSNVVPPWGHGFTEHEISGSSRTISPTEQLFERVAELEKRVLELESKLAQILPDIK